jgi:hypothetical protein
VAGQLSPVISKLKLIPVKGYNVSQMIHSPIYDINDTIALFRLFLQEFFGIFLNKES